MVKLLTNYLPQKELSSLETEHPCMPGQAREEQPASLGGARQNPLDNIQVTPREKIGC